MCGKRTMTERAAFGVTITQERLFGTIRTRRLEETNEDHEESNVT